MFRFTIRDLLWLTVVVQLGWPVPSLTAALSQRIADSKRFKLLRKRRSRP